MSTQDGGPAYVPYSVFLEWSDRFRRELSQQIKDENAETLEAIERVRTSVVNRENESRLATREKVALRVALFSGLASLVASILQYVHN